MNADKMLNQKGIGVILLIIIAGVLVVLFMFYRFGFLNSQTSKPSATPQASSSPSSVSTNPEQDPAYNLVRQEFNLNGEQLDILSRINSNDNRF